jgi:hypothetical protein
VKVTVVIVYVKLVFFGNDKNECGITEPYRKEQDDINKLLNTGKQKISSTWIDIRYAYSMLRYNKVYVKKFQKLLDK